MLVTVAILWRRNWASLCDGGLCDESKDVQLGPGRPGTCTRFIWLPRQSFSMAFHPHGIHALFSLVHICRLRHNLWFSTWLQIPVECMLQWPLKLHYGWQEKEPRNSSPKPVVVKNPSCLKRCFLFLSLASVTKRRRERKTRGLWKKERDYLEIIFFASLILLRNRRFNQWEAEAERGGNYWSLGYGRGVVIIKHLWDGREEMVKNKRFSLTSLLLYLIPLLTQGKTKPRDQGRALYLVAFLHWEGHLVGDDDRSVWLFRLREDA